MMTILPSPLNISLLHHVQGGSVSVALTRKTQMNKMACRTGGLQFTVLPSPMSLTTLGARFNHCQLNSLFNYHARAARTPSGRRPSRISRLLAWSSFWFSFKPFHGQCLPRPLFFLILHSIQLHIRETHPLSRSHTTTPNAVQNPIISTATGPLDACLRSAFSP
ncbi:hypothetical protein C8R45DRAFT_313662 [Mycena sanguinolenta]|nr:hypothetical protein C8R45DRAFT_313662 [Mycena sanguinolenta]